MSSLRRESTRKWLRRAQKASLQRKAFHCELTDRTLLRLTALKDDSKYIKALQRRATANEQINSWSSLSSAQEGQSSFFHADVGLPQDRTGY